MKKFMVAVGLLALSGCAQLQDAGNGLVDTLKSPPEVVRSAWSQVLDFVLNTLLNSIGSFLGPLVGRLGL